VFYSNFDYGFQLGEDIKNQFDWKSKIQTYNFKPEYTYYLNKNNKLNFGGEAIFYRFSPANALTISEGARSDISLDKRKSLETALFIGNEQQISPKLTVQYGLRYSRFNYIGGTVFHYGDAIAGIKKPLQSTTETEEWETIKDYGNLEPRASLRYQINESSSVKGSYNRMNQYIHLISNTTASLPIDVWQPSTNNLKPQQADQLGLGYFKNFKENKFETSLEVYYKTTRNQVEYIDGADIFINRFLESQLLSGEGRAYGVELFAKKNEGKITGWVSYTLGKSELKVNGINFGDDKINRIGNWYPTRFDQRHNFKAAAFYDLNKKISFSANFSLLTGTPTTFPTDRVTIQGYVIPYVNKNERNNYRIPTYHRLDASVTINNVWRGKKSRRGEDNLVISFYNLYARKNPFSIYFSQGKTRPAANQPIATSANQLSMVGTIVPAVSYNFKF
jgi:hypothetical protein